MQYWFNTTTGQVEEDLDEERSRAAELMGPYASREDAADALETARARTEAWDEEEKAEDEWRTGDRDHNNWDYNPLNDDD